MALVATVTNRTPSNGAASDRTVVKGTLAFDASYPTGGEVILLTQLGLDSVDSLSADPNSGYLFEWDGTNKKLKVLYPQGGEQVGGGLGAATVDSGATAMTSSAANGAVVTVDAGKAREVANTTDLSALTAVPFTAIGL